MRKAIVIVLAMMFLSGCAVYQSELYTRIKRQPVETQVEPKESSPKPDKWYDALAQAVVGLVPSILREVRLIITDTTETISSSVRDVKTATAYEETTYKRSAWFSTKPAAFEYLEKPENLNSLINTNPAVE